MVLHIDSKIKKTAEDMSQLWCLVLGGRIQNKEEKTAGGSERRRRTY